MIEQELNKSICFISPFAYPLLSKNSSDSTGGAERQFILFGRELTRRGWRVSYVTDKPKNKLTSKETLMPVYFAKFSYLGGPKWRTMFDWITLWNALAESNAYYYVLKTPAHLLFPIGIFCRIHNKKLVFWSQTSHDSSNRRQNINKLASIMQNYGLRSADIIISQTNDQKRGFEINFGIKSTVIPSIADTLEVANQEENSNDDFSNNVDILWVGNSTQNKRYEVVRELAKLLPHRKFAIAMNQGDIPRYERAKDELEKLKNVLFLGSVPPVIMETWFRKSKIFLNTSIREGFPNTFLQSWMNALPVISLNIDPDDIIKNNELGRVVDNDFIPNLNGDYEAMAKLSIPFIEELLKDSVKRTMIGNNALNYVNKNHAPRVVTQKLVEVLEDNYPQN